MNRLIICLLAAVLSFGVAAAQGPKGGDTAKKGGAKAAAAEQQCAANTQAGTRCKRKAQAGSQFCWQHARANTKKGAAKGAKKG